MSGYVVESPNAQRALQSEQGRVRDVPRPNFVLYYHPAEWQLTSDGELTPSISHMSLAPGAGADEKGNFEHRASELRTRGYVQIPHDVLGAALPDYVSRYTNHRGKGVCRTIFQKPYDDGTGTTRWRADTAAIRAFVQYLRKRDIVGRPRPEVVEGMLHAQHRVLNRLINVRPVDSGKAKRRHEEKIQAAEQAIAYLKEELAASVEVYGQPTTDARSIMFDLLEAEESSAAEDVVRAVQEGRKAGGRRPRAPKAPTAAAPAPAPTPAPPPSEGGFTVGDSDDGDDE